MIADASKSLSPLLLFSRLPSPACGGHHGVVGPEGEGCSPHLPSPVHGRGAEGEGCSLGSPPRLPLSPRPPAGEGPGVRAVRLDRLLVSPSLPLPSPARGRWAGGEGRSPRSSPCLPVSPLSPSPHLPSPARGRGAGGEGRSPGSSPRLPVFADRPSHNASANRRPAIFSVPGPSPRPFTGVSAQRY